MGAEEIKFLTVTSQWSLITNRHGSYINNGNVDLYLQQKAGGAPAPSELGVRIRPNCGFFVSVEMQEQTYVRTANGTTQLAKYENKNVGTGASALVDPVSGNSASVNATGQLHVVLRGEMDANNSSNTPLGAGGIFTGEAVETLDYAIVNISVFANVGSAIDGLSVQQSCDGEHWDVTDEYTIPANTGKNRY